MTRYATIAWFSGSSADALERAASAAAARSVALVDGEDKGAVLVSCFDDEESAPRDPEPGGAAAVHVYRIETEWLSPERQPRKARLSRHEGRPLRDVSTAPLAGLDGLAGLLWLMDRGSGRASGFSCSSRRSRWPAVTHSSATRRRAPQAGPRLLSSTTWRSFADRKPQRRRRRF